MTELTGVTLLRHLRSYKIVTSQASAVGGSLTAKFSVDLWQFGRKTTEFSIVRSMIAPKVVVTQRFTQFSIGACPRDMEDCHAQIRDA
ncbi:hypothetical protein [Rosistilla oblonga]|uniref:hypothetical protein n=1 Tax=Rosistilla oblonga TaxID=2527990 RepID=UPI003A96C27D